MISNANMPQNRNSWSPLSITPVVFHRQDPDEEFAEEYTERMMSAQMRQLDPLKEDLADWLNKTLGIDFLNRHNFLTELDNGVVLCHLAQVICEQAKSAIISTNGSNQNGFSSKIVPHIRPKCFEKAMRRSFFSRDNMDNFIRFCRSLGIHDNLLFESDDLVLHNQPRNVLLCLLEVARIATRFGIEPPGLVQLEKEIAEEERHIRGLGFNGDKNDIGMDCLLSWQFQATSTPRPLPQILMRHSYSSPASVDSTTQWNTSSTGTSDSVPSDLTEDEDWSRGSGEDPEDLINMSEGSVRSQSRTDSRNISTGAHQNDTTELDHKVQLAAKIVQRNCNCETNKCPKLNVRKVGEGKYNIAGKNVFVRLLKGRHMMVRVGGGWDTLDHFLLRHDPCQVKVIARTSPDRHQRAVAINHSQKYLHIRAKYRSPPPLRESITR